MKKSLNLIISSGLFLAMCTALLYCMGIAYQNGYLLTLDLNDSVLERSFNLTLYSGLILFINIAVLLIPRLVGVSLCIVVTTLIIVLTLRFFEKYLHLTWVKPLFKKCISFLEKKYKPKKKHDTLENKIHKFFHCVILFLIFLFFFLLLLRYMEEKGANRAQTIIQTLREPETIPEGKLITAWVRGETLKLLYLNCGSRFCAGIDPKTRIVYYFPQDQYTYTLELENNTN